MRKQTSTQGNTQTRSLRFTLTGSPGSQKGGRAGVVRKQREGIALLIALTAIAILTVTLTDLHEHTSTSYAIATAQADRVRAEYLATSSINLTRLLSANEPALRRVVGPIYQAMLGRTPPQIPVWKFANQLLMPFCDSEALKMYAEGGQLSLASAQGFDGIQGQCEIAAAAENGKINVNKAQALTGDVARAAAASQVYTLTGGYQSPSPFDALFGRTNQDGRTYQRLDLVSNIIDWWDYDQNRTTFDPVQTQVLSAGAETDAYSSFDDAYKAKNAPFDSLEELRLVAGVDDSFWATFVEPEPGHPDQDILTVYGSGALNPNDARPEAMLARLCAYLKTQPLCADPLESAKFIQLVKTVRSIMPVPWFKTSEDFLGFLEGKGGDKDLFSTLTSFLGADNALLFHPVTISQDERRQLIPAFETEAKVLTIQSTATVGSATVTIRAVVNFDSRWVPPPPNAGTMPPLGIIYYWRVS